MATADQMTAAAERRAGLLDIIKGKIEADGYPPTLSELGETTGVHRETIKKDLRVLADEGLVEFDGAPAGRAIRLTGYRVALVPVGAP